MRRALFAAIFPLPLLIAGCVSDDNAAPSGADSGPVAEDAGPTLDSTVESEASTPDAGPDATAADSAVPDAAVDATPLPVTLTVTNDEGPEQGVLVVFQDATGTVITTATTDATGRVTQQLAADSQVTAVLGTVVSPALVTIQGVQPGDALTAFDTAHLAFANTSVTIDALPDAAPPGTSGYQAYVGNCPQNGSGFTAPPTTFGGIAWPCVAAGKAPLLVASIGSTDGGSNQELGYTYEKGNALLADGGATPISPTVPWASAETTQTLSAQNVTSGSSGWLSFSEIAGGVALSNLMNFGGGSSADGGPLSETNGFVGHPGYAEAVQGEATVYEYLQSFQFDAIRSIAAHSGAPDGSTALPALDLSSVLPEITASSIDTTDAGTPSRPVVSWTSAASLATTDGIVSVTQWSVASPDAGPTTNGTWTIVSPPTATSVVPPSLPAGLGTWTINNTVPLVVAVEASFIAGYAQLRATFAALPPTQSLLSDNHSTVVPPLPVDGTLRLTAVTQAGD